MVLEWGIWAPLIFIGLQILQVVIFVIPGEIPQIASGYLFGILFGTFYSCLGIGIGSAINFFLARNLGLPFIRHIISKKHLNDFDKMATSSHAQKGFFLLFLIPGLPKDVLCYVAGFSPMRFLFFIIVSSLGRIPGILGSTIMGAAAAEKNWILFLFIAIIATILFFIGYLLRYKIEALIVKVTTGSNGINGANGTTGANGKVSRKTDNELNCVSKKI